MIDYGLGIQFKPLNDVDMHLPLKWRNNYVVRRWTRQNDLISIRDQKAWIEKQNDDPNTKMYMIWNGFAEVGVCGLTHINWVNRNAEFSLYIAPEEQRKGYGKKALKTLLSHGFNTYGFESIWGETFNGNPASNLFLSLGMQVEGLRRNFYYRDGHFINAHILSILRREWDENEEFNDCRFQKCTF